MPDGAARPWPRLMRAETAAAYLDVSPSYFRASVAPEVQHVTLSPRVIGWRRDDLDRWLDARAGHATASADNANPWHT